MDLPLQVAGHGRLRAGVQTPRTHPDCGKTGYSPRPQRHPCARTAAAIRSGGGEFDLIEPASPTAQHGIDFRAGRPVSSGYSRDLHCHPGQPPIISKFFLPSTRYAPPDINLHEPRGWHERPWMRPHVYRVHTARTTRAGASPTTTPSGLHHRRKPRTVARSTRTPRGFHRMHASYMWPRWAN